MTCFINELFINPEERVYFLHQSIVFFIILFGKINQKTERICHLSYRVQYCYILLQWTIVLIRELLLRSFLLTLLNAFHHTNVMICFSYREQYVLCAYVTSYLSQSSINWFISYINLYFSCY